MLRIQDAILYGSKGGSSPSGSIEITENGTYDVTEKAEAVVNVPQPSGKITISQNGTDIDVSGYALADVNVPSNEDAIIERTISGAYTNNNVTKIGNYAFYYCGSLTKADFPNATSIGSAAFNNCNNLSEADFPNATSIESSAFNYCSKLSEADFPNVTSIGNYAFKNCSSLTKADFPNLTSIRESAFDSCSKLSEVDFQNVSSIGNYAFYYCRSLTEADFPNLTSIGSNAFSGCTKLASLILRGSTIICTLQSYAFTSTPISSGTGYIYVPAALIDSYKAATNWNTYAAQFRALEDYTVDGTTTGDLDPTKI